MLQKKNAFWDLIREIFKNRKLLFELAKNDFKARHAGAYFGIMWMFIQPIMTIITFWFVFQIGFRQSPIEGYPYILWLMAGLIPWFFFSEGLIGATNVFIEYSYLVKKVVFKISILPVVKVLSAFFIHVFFAIFMMLIFILYKKGPSIYWIQIPYYTIALLLLILGVSYITSSMLVFFRDISPIISILLQFGMWFTPIMWSINVITEKNKIIAFILKLNPMYYIVSGYRDSLINHVWFFNRGIETILFWFITLSLILLGARIFRQLKPHFSDLL